MKQKLLTNEKLTPTHSFSIFLLPEHFGSCGDCKQVQHYSYSQILESLLDDVCINKDMQAEFMRLNQTLAARDFSKT